MFYYLKYGIAVCALSLSVNSYAQSTQATDACTNSAFPCGIEFTIIATVPTLSTGSPTSYTYQITNVGGVDTVIGLSLTEIDSLSDSGAVSIDPSSTCPNPGTLVASDSCSIILDFFPAVPGTLDWDLTVTPTNPSSQRPLVLGIETTVNSFPYEMAAGWYQVDVTTSPLMALSTDLGSTWNYFLPPMPSDFVIDGNFEASVCTGAFCVASGFYDNNTYDVSPLLAVINADNPRGAYMIDSTHPSVQPANYLTAGNLVSISCADLNDCVAVGSYKTSLTNTPFYPIAALTTDGGNTWAYTMDSSTPTPPSDMLTVVDTFPGGLIISSVSCSGSLCVAAGNYASNNLDGEPAPLTAESGDGGATWVYVIDSTYPTLPGGAVSAYFTSTSCDGGLCIAAGSYSTSTTQYPLLAVSDDGGNTWVYAIDSGTLPSDYSDLGAFTGTTCFGSRCVATGSYTSTDSGNPTKPMIVETTNAGLSFSYKTTALPSDFQNEGQLNSVSCSTLGCLAVGSYMSNGINNTIYPMAMITVDFGTLWVLGIDSSGQPLPSDFDTTGPGGAFTAASCESDGRCLAAGYYTNTSNEMAPLLTLGDGSYIINSSYPALPDGTLNSLFSATSSGTSLLKKALKR